jgi:hypothetical protein
MYLTLPPSLSPCATRECAEAAARETLVRASIGLIEPPVLDEPHRLEDSVSPDLVACPVCDGSGEIGLRQNVFGAWDTETCTWCSGTGEVYLS